jgi:hypothetical protein
MAFSNVPIYPQKIQAWSVQLVNGTGTGQVVLMAAGTNGSIVESINVTSGDVANVFVLYAFDGTTLHVLGEMAIAANAGNAAAGTTAALDVLRSGIIPGIPIDANGNPVLYVPSGWSLKVSAVTTITSGKSWDVVAMGADY